MQELLIQWWLITAVICGVLFLTGLWILGFYFIWQGIKWIAKQI